MQMTLDDAIKHCQQVADESVCECADEHRQLAQWLQELKKFKKMQTNEEWIHTLNTEQLADAIYDCTMANSWSFNKDGIKRWLKQPHKPFS
jgi:hypothetical protein